MSGNLKTAFAIAICMDLTIAGGVAFACGVTSTDPDPTAESSTSTGPVVEEPGCVGGSHNHMSDGICYCDAGYKWCAPSGLDCCHEH